jgi:hypothetical protein
MGFYLVQCGIISFCWLITHEELMGQAGIYNNFVNERKEAVSWKIA